MLHKARKNLTNVLLIEDTPSDAALVQTYLVDAANDSFHVTHAPDMASAIPLLAGQNLHAVLLDLALPETHELEGLADVQTLAPNVPVVILTGRQDEALACTAVGYGAQDYLVKDKIDSDMLQRSIRYAIQRKRYENAIQLQAHYDKLSGLPNRDLFVERLDVSLARQERNKQSIGLMLLDLNGFKEVNDTYGHEVGDCVIKEIGRRIPQCLRPYDLAARYGGDEFVVLIEDVKQPSNYSVVAQKLIESISLPMIVQSHQIKIGVSIGIALSDGNTKIPADTLLRQADTAMYRAKDKDLSSYEFYGRAPVKTLFGGHIWPKVV